MVESPSQLTEVAASLERADRIALDTESNSLHVYAEQVCYVQLKANDRVFLVDTVAVRDLSLLKPSLEDPGITKLLHGADYDVVCLKRDFDIGLSPIFDTMIAAQMLGYEQLGLAALVSRHFDVTMNKSLSKNNWGKRPLNEEYIPYLVDDVIYLEELHDILHGALEEQDYLEEAAIEFSRVSRQEWRGGAGLAPEGFRRIKGARNLNQTDLSILKELYAVRDALAQDMNVPVFRIMGNEQMLAVARRRPTDLRKLARIRGFTSRVIKRMGTQVIEAVRAGVANKTEVPLRVKQKGERPTEAQSMVSEELRRWRRGEIARRKAPSIVVLPNHVMERISRSCPRDLEQLSQIEGLGEGRLDRYGDVILGIVNDVLGD